MPKLPNILIHVGQGDASFLIDGYKLPANAQILRDFTVGPINPEYPKAGTAVTVTFIANEVTVLGPDPKSLARGNTKETK